MPVVDTACNVSKTEVVFVLNKIVEKSQPVTGGLLRTSSAKPLSNNSEKKNKRRCAFVGQSNEATICEQ